MEYGVFTFTLLCSTFEISENRSFHNLFVSLLLLVLLTSLLKNEYLCYVESVNLQKSGIFWSRIMKKSSDQIFKITINYPFNPLSADVGYGRHPSFHFICQCQNFWQEVWKLDFWTAFFWNEKKKNSKNWICIFQNFAISNSK